jgi:hypothetical protein
MRRHECVARCALFAHAEGWEVRVVLDGQHILSRRCDVTTDVFAYADEWKRRMLERGWTRMRPSRPSRTVRRLNVQPA